MKRFSPDRSGLFQDDPAPIHRAQGRMDRFNENESEVNHMLWPLHSPDFKPPSVKH